jgi:hypothetical protein
MGSDLAQEPREDPASDGGAVMTKRTKKKSAKLPTYKSGNTLFDHPGAVTVTGEVDGDYISKLTALPFVRDGKPGKGRCFWSVKSTGKYEDDWEQGRQYARLAVEFLKYTPTL